MKFGNLRKDLKVFSTIAILFILAVDYFSLIGNAYGEPESAYLFITPPMSVAKEVGEVFNLSINVSNVENLSRVEFTIVFNESLLDVIQVAQGPFFPPPPKSSFEFEVGIPGHVNVCISLADPEAGISGSGTLAYLSFKVAQDPGVCMASTLNFNQTSLLNSALSPIPHDSVGAVYFWRSTLTDPSDDGAFLDLYTQKGGVGPNAAGGYFAAGEMVHLISKVTYNNAPVQNELVAFEVLNPSSEVVLIRTAITDEQGLAIISFRIPVILSSNGTWTAISTVSLADKVAWDITTFQVYLIIPVGGYTVSMNVKSEKESTAQYYCNGNTNSSLNNHKTQNHTKTC